MGRSEVRVTINRPVKIVFDVYTQPDTWSWTDMGKIAWTRGKPWEVDSRMQFEPNDAYHVTVNQVVTHFEPYRRVDFISHFGGITLLSEIYFGALSENEAEIYTRLEFIGTFSRVAGFAVGPAIEQATRKFYVDLKRECESRSPEASTGDGA